MWVVRVAMWAARVVAAAMMVSTEVEWGGMMGLIAVVAFLAVMGVLDIGRSLLGTLPERRVARRASTLAVPCSYSLPNSRRSRRVPQ